MRNAKSGTGKTHTFIEIIHQLTTASTSNSKVNHVLVYGVSNLSVDNMKALVDPSKRKCGKKLKPSIKSK